nr:hypothetical protein [Micromonospora sp. DSM 115978]
MDSEPAAAGSVLDLDIPLNEGAPLLRDSRFHHVWKSRIPVSIAIALVLGASVIAAVSTHWWDLRQQRQAQQAAVSLQVLVPASGAITAGGVDGSNVTVEGSLALVNSGPAEVEVTALHAVEDGLTVWTSKAPGVVRPGTGLVDVRATLDCAVGMPIEPVRLTMQVRTADGRGRESSSLLATAGTLWHDLLDRMCHPEEA